MMLYHRYQSLFCFPTCHCGSPSCQLYPDKALGLWGRFAWTSCIKVNFPRKSKRCFKLGKSNNTERPSVTRSIREKGKGRTKDLLLFTVSLQGEPLLSCFVSMSCGNLCTDAQSPGWFWPPHQRAGVSEAHCFLPSLLPSLLPAPGLLPCAAQEQPPPSLHMGYPNSSYERISLWKKGKLKR